MITAIVLMSTAFGAQAESSATGESDYFGGPVTVLGEMVIILLLAKIGGHSAIRLGQPAVLGELGAGMLIGLYMGVISSNGYSVYLLEQIETDDSHMQVLAQMGVVLLLFRVGLESDFLELLKNGVSALLVAATGIALPVIAGAAVCAYFAIETSAEHSTIHLYLFVGATMAATSVGMTARVFEDLKISGTREARIVLAAAVIDDILGLLVFAVISGLIFSQSAGEDPHIVAAVFKVLAQTTAFFVLVAVLGRWVMPPVFRALLRLRGEGVGVAIALAFCFGMAYLSNFFHLATVVGAFLAGLMINNRYFPPSNETDDPIRMTRQRLEGLIDPLYQVLAPVFFVILGMQVEFDVFVDWNHIQYAIALVFVAVLTKVLSGLWVPGSLWTRLTVGVGMIPRGEVGLIFASMGLASGVVGDTTYSALVLVVFATTLVTPPALKLLIGKNNAGHGNTVTESPS